MLFNKICPPALLYLVFSITQIAIDSMKGMYNTALMKVWVTSIFTILLNYLCQSGLGIVSWIIVFIPFILMTLIVAILLVMFGLDPTSGKLKRRTDMDHNPVKPDPDHHPHKHSHKHDHKGKGHHHHHPRGASSETDTEVDVDIHLHKRKQRYKFLDVREQEILDRIDRYTNSRIVIPGVNQSAVDHKNRKRSPTLGSDYDNSNPITNQKRKDINGIFYILTNMNEAHEAAYFLNQGDSCLQQNTEKACNTCIRKLIKRTIAKLGPDKGPVFFQRVKDKYPEYVE